MPYFEIDDSTLEGLNEDIKQNFKKFEPEDTSGLKNKANELLSENKKKDAAFAELQAENAKLTAQIKKGKLNNNGDEAEKLADAIARNEEAQKQLADLQNKIVDEKLNTEAMKVATTLAKDTRRAALLAEKVKNRLKYENDSLTVLSKDGKPTISTVTELASEIKTEYDFLVDSSGASGGGAPGGTGRASDSPKTVSRKDFEGMSQNQRSTFVKEGGSISEE